jgi:hypothetical protein
MFSGPVTICPMLSGSTVTTAWRVLGLRIETASRYGGLLRIYWISSSGQPTVGGPPAWGLGRGLTTLPRKTQYLLRITAHSLGTGRITWHKLSTGKLTWDLAHEMLGAYGSGQGLMASCCEWGDEPSGSCATELVSNNMPRSGCWEILFYEIPVRQSFD